MLCKRCMTVMATGTTYEQRRDGKSSARRFTYVKGVMIRFIQKNRIFRNVWIRHQIDVEINNT